METYISILRGINVSGKNMIKMPELKALYESLKFKDVITYIQSGNVIFKADGKQSITDMIKDINKKIQTKYKFEVPILIRTAREMQEVLKTNPLLKEKGIDMEKLHVTFLGELPAKDKLDVVKQVSYPPDRFIIVGKEIYLYCPNGYGNTKLHNNFFEGKLKVQATTRNWNTVNKLVEIALGEN
jgi:uncharacterized protein (DUF1697 family)